MDEKIIQEVETVEQAAPVEEVKDPLALNEREQEKMREIASRIDLNNNQQILQYGTAAQSGLAQFSETALANARGKDLGEVGKKIGELMSELKSFDAADMNKGGIFSLFRRASKRMEMVRAKYTKVSKNVDNIAEKLENHQLSLMKDLEILDQLYEKNLEYFKALTIYIEAGQLRLRRERETTLSSMREIAKRTGLAHDAQNAKDYEEKCLRFERKLYDLELTRNICLQMGPQIRLLQSNDTALTEKIQSSLLNTIPLWKNQMVLALGLSHAKLAMEAQRSVTDMTNELLTENAKALQEATVSTAREVERGIVDVETLKATNESLIATLDEVLQIQAEGAQKRRNAEAELQDIETKLKMKLLEMQDK